MTIGGNTAMGGSPLGVVVMLTIGNVHSVDFSDKVIYAEPRGGRTVVNDSPGW